MKLSTLRTAICIVLSVSDVSVAQTVRLTAKSKEVQHGSAIRLEVILNASSDSAPSGLQWEIRVPAGMRIAEIEEGKAVKKAGKTLVCNGARCLVYGWNRTTIPNGQIAIAKIRLADGLDGTRGSAKFGYQSHSRNRKQEIQILGVVAASLDGRTIKAVSVSGAASTSNATRRLP